MALFHAWIEHPAFGAEFHPFGRVLGLGQLERDRDFLVVDEVVEGVPDAFEAHPAPADVEQTPHHAVGIHGSETLGAPETTADCRCCPDCPPN